MKITTTFKIVFRIMFIVAWAWGLNSCSKKEPQPPIVDKPDTIPVPVSAVWVDYLCHMHHHDFIAQQLDSSYDRDSVWLKVKIDLPADTITVLIDTQYMYFSQLHLDTNNIIHGTIPSSNFHDYNGIEIWKSNDSISCWTGYTSMPVDHISTYTGHLR